MSNRLSYRLNSGTRENLEADTNKREASFMELGPWIQARFRQEYARIITLSL
jgi:hypothetical protein